MERGSKLLLIFILLVIVTVIGLKHKQFVLDKDFIMIGQVPCDPSIEACFKVQCDGECEASAIVNSDGSPYKKVSILAANAPACLEEENCTDFVCPADDETCSITYCSDETLEEGEECVVVDDMLLKDEAPDIF